MNKETLKLRLFSRFKLPLLYKAKPSVIDLTSQSVTIKIPCNRANGNHRGSLYFGAIAMGAECAAGYIFQKHIVENHLKNGLTIGSSEMNIIKSFKSDAFFKVMLTDTVDNLVSISDNGKVKYNIDVIGYDSFGNTCAELKFGVVLQPPRKAF